VGVGRTASIPARQPWADAGDRAARCRQCDLLHRPIRLSVADAAKDFPPYSTVQRHFYDRCSRGVWQAINHVLLMEVGEAAGREASPTAGVIDSQSVKTAESSGPRGYDPGKKINGR
jgi:transposase